MCAGGHAVKCPSCGMENPAGMRFCGGCGAPLTDPEPPPAPGEPRGDHAVGTPLRRRAQDRSPSSSPTSPASPRSPRSSTPRPCATSSRACFDRLVPCIQRYGGTIDKFMGDEIMALFGAPRAHENDPERALRAALEMRRRPGGLQPRSGSSALAIHFGVNTGLVYAGGVGGGGREGLLGHGGRGERRRAAQDHRRRPVRSWWEQTPTGRPGDLFEWLRVGPVQVKGKAEPVTAYRLLDVRAAARPAQRGRTTRGLTSPLVGREGELARLQSGDRPVCSGGRGRRRSRRR